MTRITKLHDEQSSGRPIQDAPRKPCERCLSVRWYTHRADPVTGSAQHECIECGNVVVTLVASQKVQRHVMVERTEKRRKTA